MKKKVLYIVLIFVLLLGIFSMYQDYEQRKNVIHKECVPYHSVYDKDKDGIDDQMDILENARQYVSTRPKYKSIYYNTGYPDDDHGVCTDVVAQAFLHSGYDLMELVNTHIINNRDLYDIDTVDKNIDFRRVRNLQVFFSENAISLTKNIYDVSEWQGGDIVIFREHIGIVSDKRNHNGIPYIIHHANPIQIFYEEDILEHRKNKIIGHYRWN